MNDEERISDLLLRWEEAQERGDDLDAETLCAECPELIDDVRKRIAALRRMSWMTRSQSQPDEPDPKVGSTLADRYRIDELIGEGGHGKVYRGFDPELQRSVAIKLPNDRRVNTSDLLEEARKVARLRHPGIVTVYDVGQHEGEPFIVSDFVSGTTLCEAGPFTPQEAAGLIAEIADSLHAAHEQGFVHRDIKPANILIDQQGRPLLTDFGIATVAGESQAQIVGTLPFMAPEQLGDDPANGDPRTDIWSLGVVLYELLTGKLPFDDPSPAKLCEQIRNHVPLPPRGINPHIPPALEAVVLRCLSKAPEERYETAAELALALRTVRHKPTVLKGTLLGLIVLAPLMIFGASNWFNSSPSATVSESPQIEGMYFDGQTRIVTPVARFAPCTLEAWVRPEHDAHAAFIGSDIRGEYGLSLGTHGGILFAELLSGAIETHAHVTPGIWSHVAVVFDTEETVLFLNGYEVGRGEPTAIFGDAPFVIGGLSFGSRELQFRGHMKWVRISEGARYRDDFTPSDSLLQPDERTVLLYDVRKVAGNEITDLSNRGNHGQREESPITAAWQPLQRHALHFEGGAVIETPVKPSLPCTLEAWVLPRHSEGVQHIIGSPSLSLMLQGFDLAPEGFPGIETGNPEVGPGHWTHVAGVFTDDGTYLFVNGRKVWNSVAFKPEGDHSFVIGGVSTTDAAGQFLGQIRCVRITRGERFSESFAPDHNFTADENTILIYDGKNVAGLRVVDVSGNGNDGLWTEVAP